MRHWLGQAGRVLRGLLAFALGLLIIAAVGIGALAVRLHEGPVRLDWAARRLEAALARGNRPVHLAIGSAELAWEGFHHGFESPLDLRLANVSARNVAGEEILTIPRAFVAFSLSRLLIGEIAPRDLNLSLGTLHLYHHVSGLLAVSAHREERAAPALLSSAASPPDPAALLDETGLSLAALRRLRVHADRIVVSEIGAGGEDEGVWELRALEVTYRRFLLRNRIEGKAEAHLVLGRADIALTASLDAPEGITAPWRLRVENAPVVPAALAGALPQLAPLGRIDAPVSLAAEAPVTRAGLAGPVRLGVTLGAGRLVLGADPLPVSSGTAAAEVDLSRQVASLLHAELSVGDAAQPTRLTASGTFRFGDEPAAVSLDLGFDQADLAALPRLWPQELAPHARAWVVENVTAGVVKGGEFQLTLLLPKEGEPRLTAAAGGMNGEGLRVGWLETLPPITGGAARLVLLDPDTLEIDATSGSVAAGGGSVTLGAGSVVKITGLAAPDQDLHLDLALAGSLGAGLAILAAPRLHLLDHAPGLLRPGVRGDFDGKLHLDLPLKKEIHDEDITLAADVALSHARLPRLVLGRDVSEGNLHLSVTQSTLSGDGTALWASMPVRLGVDADFTKGDAAQEVLHVAGELTGSARALAAFGIDPAGRLQGTFPLDFTYTEHRDGRAEVSLLADFTRSVLSPAPLAWEKPAGIPARLSADLLLAHDRLQAIRALDLEGGGAFCQGTYDTAGHAPRLDLAACRLGPSDLHGEIDFPARPGDPYRIELSGAFLDLSARAAKGSLRGGEGSGGVGAGGSEAAGAGAAAEESDATEAGEAGGRGAPVAFHARFDSVAIARAAHDTPALRLGFVDVSAEDDGSRRWSGAASGFAASRAPFRISVRREGSGRSVAAEASDAGALARALGLLSTMEGGRLSLHGKFEDTRRGHPFAGTLEIDDFRLIRAPLTLKLLQAMTLYGMVGQMEHEGIRFDHLVVPFSYASPTLHLTNARMWNSALGFTANGEIETERKTMRLTGTIIPAYYFNSLLGKIPVIGRLFSPEKGGGVVAANYTAEGPIDDPKVSVNPLSALTPGITRDIFNLFQ